MKQYKKTIWLTGQGYAKEGTCPRVPHTFATKSNKQNFIGPADAEDITHVWAGTERGIVPLDDVPHTQEEVHDSPVMSAEELANES
jgi:hypothetical protein